MFKIHNNRINTNKTNTISSKYTLRTITLSSNNNIINSSTLNNSINFLQSTTMTKDIKNIEQIK